MLAGKGAAKYFANTLEIQGGLFLWLGRGRCMQWLFTKLRGGMITAGGRRTELADIRGKEVVEDWVSTGMRRTKMATGIGRCDGKCTKVIVVLGLVFRDEGSVTGVLFGDIASDTTGLGWSRKDGCRHGWMEGKPAGGEHEAARRGSGEVAGAGVRGSV